MKIRLLSHIFILLTVTLSNQVLAKGWNDWPKKPLKHPNGIEYSQPLKEGGSRVQIFQRKALEKAFSGSLDKLGNSQKNKLETALSIVGMGMISNESFKNNQLRGVVELSEGSTNFAAALTGKSGQETLIITLIPTKNELKKRLANNRKITKTQPQKRAVKSIKAKTNHLANYPLPRKANTRSRRYWDGWKTMKGGNQSYAKPGDPSSPRRLVTTIKGTNIKQAIKKAMAQYKIKSGRLVSYKNSQAAKSLLGNSSTTAIGTSQLNSHKAVLFVSASRKKNQNSVWVSLVEIPAKTFVAWGGISAIMWGDDFFQKRNAISTKRRQQIARSSLASQLSVYHATNEKLLYSYAKGIMRTQANTTMMMTELNYDLLLGGDISSPFIAD